jgi:predicted alpha/beta superfamily hydrolase
MSDAALSDVDAVTLKSCHTHEGYRILVARPAESADVPLPLLVLDATVTFGTVVEITRLLRFSDDLPAMLVVAVGYQERRFGDALGPRQRDLTFSRSAAGGWPDDPDMMGGGSHFASFLRGELKPWVAEHYPISANDWGILGSSLGGLFATHLLLETPDLFQRYGIGSPSYWWDDKTIFLVEASGALSRGVLPARVAITVGEYEQPDGRRRYIASLPEARRVEETANDKVHPHPDMVGDAERMYHALRDRRCEGLRLSFEVIPGEYHQTVIPAHLSRAIRLLYDGPI